MGPGVRRGDVFIAAKLKTVIPAQAGTHTTLNLAAVRFKNSTTVQKRAYQYSISTVLPESGRRRMMLTQQWTHV